MNEYLWVISTLLAVAAGGYGIYAILKRGFKGAMFGHRITSTTGTTIEYRYQGAKHTIRIHRFDGNDLFGLEIGRWMGVLGETAPFVVPCEELLQLRDMISEFVEENSGTESKG